ncbi:MAG: DNA/RNA nuclease SfsA [Treponema sp.]|jgi:sugar fermentation stimulation protein A|nr:DNA/RNA nuclease SfsA [Treponema sp.]
MNEQVKLFQNDLEAVFAARPNRFLIIAKAGGKETACHCPDPGRLTELLFPGARLILEKRRGGQSAVKRGPPAKTAYTAAAVRYRGEIVPLFSARLNRAAEKLILKKIIPGLKEIHAEFSLGNSRFDFLCIDEKGRRHLVEVKACSLVEHGVAMFPDAPSGRALKHLEELASLGSRGYCCHLLFVITHGEPKVFVPNPHTDPAFAAALYRYGRPARSRTAGGRTRETGEGAAPVLVHAALIRCGEDGAARLAAAPGGGGFIPPDLSRGELAEKNSGSYLIILEIPKEIPEAGKRAKAKARRDASGTLILEAGALGNIEIKPGWYVYAGSAMKNLSQRISRHLRRVKKKKHWHIDYLSPWASKIRALPICSRRNLECDLAAALEALGGKGVPGFGCSDCRGAGGRRCSSHLFYFRKNPMEERSFVEMLMRFRHEEMKTAKA